LNDGQIKAFGTPEEVITHKNIKSVYNINAIIKRNVYNDSIYVTPLRDEVSNSLNYVKGNHKKKVHVIVGGGSALKILPKLKKFYVSVGVVNVLDDDYILAKDLSYKIISEAPFSPISEDSLKKLDSHLEQVDLIILTNIPFGKNNIDNLNALYRSNKMILIFEKTSIEERDYTSGLATDLYYKIMNEKNVKVVNHLEDLLNFITIF